MQSADIITNKRSLESTVLVDDGQIVVLGGLIQDDQQSTIDKVPLLGDIPFLGALFKYQSRTHKRTNLMVFLRPDGAEGREGRGLAHGRPLRLHPQPAGRDRRCRATWLLPASRATQLPPLHDDAATSNRSAK